MSHIRQQRAVRNRRIISPSQPALVPPLAPVIVSIALGALDLQGIVIAQPPALGGTAVPLVVSGIPNIRRTATDALPTVCTLLPDGLTIRLEYAGGAVIAGESFWVGPQDGAVRTSQGSYLAPGRIATPTPLPPEVTPATWTATATGLNEVTLSVAGNGTDYTVAVPSHWRKGPANTYPTVYVIPGDYDGRAPWTAVLTYADAVTPGDSLQYDGPSLPIGNAGVRTITQAAGVIG